MRLLGKRSATACDRAREYASLGLDGELSEFEQASLRAHVARCKPCRGFERDISAATTALRAAPLEAPARSFALPARRRFGAVKLMPVASAAAVIVAALSLGTILSRPDSRSSTAVAQKNRLAALKPSLRELRLHELRTNPAAADLRHPGRNVIL